jgi:hypothetical protein
MQVHSRERKLCLYVHACACFCVTSSPSHHFHHCTPWTHCTPWWEVNILPVGIGVPCIVSCYLLVMILAVSLLPEARERNWTLWCTHQVCLLVHSHSHCWSPHTVTSVHLSPGKNNKYTDSVRFLCHRNQGPPWNTILSYFSSHPISRR